MNWLLVNVIIFFLLLVPTQQQGRRVPSAQPSQTVGNRRQQPQPQQPTENRPGASRGQPRPPDDEEESDKDSDDGEKFTCPKSDGLYADPASCKKFYLCGSWHAWAQSCPPSLYFDDKLKFCTFKTAQLTCGPVNEEEVREEEARSQQNFPVCDQSKCHLPTCFCTEEGTQIPGNLAPNQVPQMILLSFSGAMNELVFDHYKKVLGYSGKFSTHQTRTNPNGCGFRGTFFVNHEYTNYAQIQWLAANGHEIALHSITHRLPELWWTDKANYSDWAEEMIGMREIILSMVGAQSNGILSRDNLVGMRVPYVKPGGDPMFEMAQDFGLLYDSSIVAPRGSPPYWPFTLDYRQPFDCANNKKGSEKKDDGGDLVDNLRERSKQKRDVIKSREKRQSPFLGRPLKCPTKSYNGLWEVPINPLFNEVNICHHADQCVFPSSSGDDTSDIVDFLIENFERHYNTNRAPFQLSFHVTWFTSKTHSRALSRFLDHVQQNYKDVWFVTFQQMISWIKDPQPITQLNFKCENRTSFATCNRPHSCALRHYLDKDNNAATAENSVRTDTRYMQLCHPISCPPQYPWFGNYQGKSKDFKTIMQLVEEAVGPDQANQAGQGK